jgi:enoyl-CoA hydratase
MTDLPLLYQKKDGIAYLTFNRPEARNALTPEMICRLADAWENFLHDDSLRVAIVTGAQDKAFAAGFDLLRTIPLLSGARPPEDKWDLRLLQDADRMADVIILRGASICKPIIAAINGACMGGAVEMLQGMDLRLAAEHATISLPEATLGFMPAGGSTVRLPRQIPYCKAMELLLLGTPMTAHEAWRIGLVNEVVPAPDLMARAEAWARKIASNGPLALRKIKETVLRTSGIALEDAYSIEAENYRATIRSNDAKEGPIAFKERRAPTFTGT